ncbi:response regulator [Paenibacillus sinopodophylli]|uniref:response regulator n=1 Tax=Paenibacillus sinopodophylli TaxID=1837342 RepID=UPI00110CDCF6|nr:response regulator [Paenibacillus sinopodophylli]
MISVMIVEDDVMFRYAIRSLMDWTAIDFHITAEAVNGRHALELISENEPDLILTDISMPIMNGISLIETVKREYPKVKIIVLSSYNDFEFVKEALTLGAEDYLLKHDLKEQQLHQLLIKCKKKIEEEQKHEAGNKVIKDNLSSIIQRLVSRILKEESSNKLELVSSLRSLNQDMPISNMTLLAIESNPIAFANIELELRQQLDMETVQYVFAQVEHHLAVLIVGFRDEKSETKKYNIIHNIAEQVRLSIHRTEKHSITIGIGGNCEDIEKLSECFSQALSALNIKLYEGKNKIYHYQAHVRVKGKRETHVFARLEAMTELLSAGNYGGLVAESNALFEQLKESHADIREIRTVFHELDILLHMAARILKVKLSEITGESYLWRDDMLKDTEVMDEIMREFNGYLQRLIEIASRKNEGYGRAVQKILKWVQKNYMNEVSINEIAAALHLTPNYVSNLFKQETGLRITEYINHLRIEEAKRYLKTTDMKIYEVAEKVGFKNASYFSTVFKEVTGIKVITYKNS